MVKSIRIDLGKKWTPARRHYRGCDRCFYLFLVMLIELNFVMGDLDYLVETEIENIFFAETHDL